MSAQRVAVVSGGSKGLGAVLVRRLLDDGWRVATFSRTASSFVDRTRAEHPESFWWTALDATDLPAAQVFVSHVVDRFSGVDLLVNNAGALGRPELLLTTPQSRLQSAITVNLVAPMVLTQACVRAMSRRAGGQVITISSVNAIRGNRGVAAYSAAKAGLDAFGRSLARELGPLGVRVNSVVPGFFDSDLTDAVTRQDRERIRRRTPLGRLAGVAEIADAVCLLASPNSSFITGQTLVVDGGLTC